MASNLKFIEDTCRERGWKYIGKDGKHVYIECDGFIFKPHRTNFPPITLNPSKCTKPTEYARHLLSLKFKGYDFSRFSYINNSSKSEVVCYKHGSYLVSYNQLMTTGTSGCNNCKNELTAIRNSDAKISRDAWIERFNEIHGEKYDYRFIESDIHSLKNISVFCKKHGIFKQKAYLHYRGSGCKFCATEVHNSYTRSGYVDRCKNGSNIYVLQLSNGVENFVKIGISKNLESRIYTIRKESGYECLRYYYDFNEDAGKIYDLEKLLHKYFAAYKYSPKSKFAGMGECFSIDFEFVVDYYESNF